MAMKVMQKKYLLVNQTTDQEMVVYPERWCGLNRDNHRKTNKDGFRQRIFKVLDSKGVDLSIFDGNASARPNDSIASDEVVLYNKMGSYPTVENNGEVWKLVCIPGEQAKKPRKKKAVIPDAPTTTTA